MQAEKLSSGKMKKNVLIYSVCVGVGLGIVLGIVKITFHVPLIYFILPSYSITAVLTLFSSEEFVNVAWDCGGVTTGM
jgi:phosphate starvation-inducible membrane PsiE